MHTECEAFNYDVYTVENTETVNAMYSERILRNLKLSSLYRVYFLHFAYLQRFSNLLFFNVV